MRQRIIVVLPAYNEESSILALLNGYDEMVAANDIFIKIIVVNDGSTDNTVSEINKYSGPLPIEIKDNEVNAGLGKVLKQGLRTAVENGNRDDIVITMDADNSHNPAQIPLMIKKINEGYDIVIASRYRKGSKIVGLSNFRKLTSFLAGSLFVVFAPIDGVRDYTCGFRAYKYEILQKGFTLYNERLIQETGFSCMVEVLLKLNSFRPKIKEIPMVLRYDLKLSASKMKIWSTIRKTLSVLYKYKTGF